MNNADEIVRGMRGYAVRAQKNNEFNTMQDFDAAADLIESLQADAASYQQVKNVLQREGFADIETMISRYKQVMFDANEISIEQDERIELLEADLARVTAERDAAVSDLYTACKTSPCNNGVCVSRNCMGNVMPCNFEWRGVQLSVEETK